MRSEPVTYRIPEGRFRPRATEPWPCKDGFISADSLEVCEVEEIHKLCRGRTGKLAIVGPGIDMGQPLFTDRIARAVGCFPNMETVHESAQFGTFLAGVAAGARDAGGPFGTAPECDIGVWNVMDGLMQADEEEVEQAIESAVAWGADAILLPLCSNVASARVSNAIRLAVENGKVVVIPAMMDSSISKPSFHPTTARDVLAVAATTNCGCAAPWSASGSLVDVGVPGEKIYGPITATRGGFFSGTSAAAAYMAGLVVIVRCVEREIDLPPMGVEKLISEIRRSCIANPAECDGPLTGAGIPRLLPLLNRLINGDTPLFDDVARGKAICIVDPSRVPDGYDAVIYTRK